MHHVYGRIRERSAHLIANVHMRVARGDGSTRASLAYGVCFFRLIGDTFGEVVRDWDVDRLGPSESRCTSGNGMLFWL